MDVDVIDVGLLAPDEKSKLSDTKKFQLLIFSLSSHKKESYIILKSSLNS